MKKNKTNLNGLLLYKTIWKPYKFSKLTIEKAM